MRLVRASSGRQVAAAAVVVDVTAVADTAVVAGAMAAAAAASDEAAATSHRCRPRTGAAESWYRSGFALEADFILRAGHRRALQLHCANLGRAGFEPAKA